MGGGFVDMLGLAFAISLIAQEGRLGEAQASHESAKTLREPGLRGPDFVLSLTPTPVFGGRSTVLSGYRSRAELDSEVLRLETVSEDGRTVVAWARGDTCPAVREFMRDQAASIDVRLPLARGEVPPAPMTDGVILRFHVPFAAVNGASTSIDLTGNLDSPLYGWWTRHETALASCWEISDRP